MGLIRTLARLALAWVFVYGGQDVLRNPEPRAKTGGPFVDWLRGIVPFLPQDTILLVRADAGVMVGAGILLALGKFPRFAATALAAALVPTTLAGHRFWEETDPRTRAMQRTQFLKNLGLFGGTLLVLAERPRRPRAKR